MKRKWISVLSLILAGCTTSDKEIRADIAAKARKNLNFAGLDYVVANGVVTVTGNCPSTKAYAEVQQTLKGMGVIKSVKYQVNILPVKLNEQTPKKLKMDSLLADYPNVIGEIDTIGITLKGQVRNDEIPKLLKSLSDNGFTIVRDSTIK